MIRETGLSSPVKYFYWPFQGGTSFVGHLCYLCLVFVMLSRLFIAALWSADLLALICDVYCDFVTFPFEILGQVWYLSVSISDSCCLSYFYCYQIVNNKGADQAAQMHRWVCAFVVRTLQLGFLSPGPISPLQVTVLKVKQKWQGYLFIFFEKVNFNICFLTSLLQ